MYYTIFIRRLGSDEFHKVQEIREDQLSAMLQNNHKGVLKKYLQQWREPQRYIGAHFIVFGPNNQRLIVAKIFKAVAPEELFQLKEV